MIRLPYCLRRSEGRPCRIPHWGGLRYMIATLCENFYIKHAKLPRHSLNNDKNNSPKIIVSLTTFPGRIDVVGYAIKSLMLQTVQPDKIIIWLAKTQFSCVPEQLNTYIERGLEVRFCDDMRSHKKYFYALQEQQPNEVVITFDDDIIFEKDAIEKLVRFHRKHPDCIICNRAQKILFDKSGFKPFRSWPIFNDVKAGEPTLGMIPSTGAGCLYPYGIMPQITFDKEIIKANVFETDDLWIGFVNISHGNRIVKTLTHQATLVNVKNSQKESLTSKNDLGDGNVRALERLIKLFPDTLQILCNEN